MGFFLSSYVKHRYQVEKYLVDKLEVYESAVGDANTKMAPKIERFPPAFQSIPRNPIVLDLAYNCIEFPVLDERKKKVQRGFISRLWGWRSFLPQVKRISGSVSLLLHILRNSLLLFSFWITNPIAWVFFCHSVDFFPKNHNLDFRPRLHFAAPLMTLEVLDI